METSHLQIKFPASLRGSPSKDTCSGLEPRLSDDSVLLFTTGLLIVNLCLE